MGNTNRGKKNIFGSSFPLENDYFFVVKKTMRYIYKDLDSNTYNNSIAIEKKHFDKATVMRSNYYPKSKKVHWKSYIISYFDKQRKNGTLWYGDIIDEISSHSFLDENEFLSQIFYQNFEAKTMPKCLIKINKDLERESEMLSTSMSRSKNKNKYDNSDDEKEEDFSLFKEQKTQNSLSTINITGVTNNYGGSFNESESRESNNELSEHYKQNRKRVKKLIKIFKRHLNNKDDNGKYNHPIYIIIKIFEKKIAYVIKEKIKELQEIRDQNEEEYESDLNLLTQEIVIQIQKFIIKAQSALKLFYVEAVDLGCFFEEKDELINLVTSTLFQIGSIHDDIYNLFSLVLEKRVYDFGNKLHSMYEMTPQSLGINERFSLDQSTIIAQNSLKINAPESIEEIEQDKSVKNDNLTLNSISLSGSKQRITITESKLIEVSKDFHSKHEFNGYNTVFKIIRSIAKNRIPIEKMMLIASISSEITECVNHFWRGFDKYISPQYLNINADELMSLFIYALVQSQFPEIIIHLKIIDEFTSKTTKETMIAYYTTTMEAAIDFILREDFKKSNVNEINTNTLEIEKE